MEEEEVRGPYEEVAGPYPEEALGQRDRELVVEEVAPC